VFFYKNRFGAYEISIGNPPGVYDMFDDHDPLGTPPPFGPLTGARVIIKNESRSDLSIVGLEVHNEDNEEQQMFYNSIMWNPPGPITDMRMAFIDIVSTPSMPLATPGDTFVASIIVRNSYGNVWTVPLNFYDNGGTPNNTLHGTIPDNLRFITFGHDDYKDLDSGTGGTSFNTFYFMSQALYDGIILVPKSEFDPIPPGTDENRETGLTNRLWARNDNDFFFDEPGIPGFLDRFPDAKVIRRIPPTTTSGAAYSMSTNNIYEGDPRPWALNEDAYYVFFIVREMKSVGGVMKNVERVYGDGPRTVAGNRLFLLDVRPDQAPRILLWNYADRSNRPSGTQYQMSTSRIHVRSPSGIRHGTSPGVVITAIDNTSLHNAGTYRNRTFAPITIFRFRSHNGIINFHPTTDRGGHLPPIVP
jgi:hypothetical protein